MCEYFLNDPFFKIKKKWTEKVTHENFSRFELRIFINVTSFHTDFLAVVLNIFHVLIALYKV
jgi:hypothetical protein